MRWTELILRPDQRASSPADAAPESRAAVSRRFCWWERRGFMDQRRALGFFWTVARALRPIPVDEPLALRTRTGCTRAGKSGGPPPMKVRSFVSLSADSPGQPLDWKRFR